MNKDIFQKSVLENFKYLQVEYNFSYPVTEDLGREIFIKYERNNQTVSISLEAGSEPLIEIFHPSSETGHEPVPWASKNGINRSRRFPKVETHSKFIETDENESIQHIKEMSVSLKKNEQPWLKA